MLDRWDILLLIISVMIAVRSLLRLMQRRRDRLVAEVQEQVDAHQAAMARQAAANAAAAKKKNAA